MVTCPTCLTNILKIFQESDLKICPTLVSERFKDLPNFGFGYLCNVRIRSTGKIMNYFDLFDAGR